MGKPNISSPNHLIYTTSILPSSMVRGITSEQSSGNLWKMSMKNKWVRFLEYFFFSKVNLWILFSMNFLKPCYLGHLRESDGKIHFFFPYLKCCNCSLAAQMRKKRPVVDSYWERARDSESALKTSVLPRKHHYIKMLVGVQTLQLWLGDALYFEKTQLLDKVAV